MISCSLLERPYGILIRQKKWPTGNMGFVSCASGVNCTTLSELCIGIGRQGARAVAFSTASSGCGICSKVA